MNERCIYARVSHPVVNLNSQYQRTNQITNLFLSFPHPLPLASICSYPPSPFYFLSLFKWRVSAYKPRIPSLTHDPRLLTYHVFSVDPLAMSQKPNAIIFGWSSSISLSLVTPPLSPPRLRRRFSPSLRWSQHLFSFTGRFSRAFRGREPRLGI
jgi:hypothetical protein